MEGFLTLGFCNPSRRVSSSKVTDDFETTASYDRGEWTVVIKRSLRAAGGVSFVQNQFVPVAFSVWDGWNHERGNKRALTSWVYVYTEPAAVISPLGPTMRVFLLALLIEVLVIYAIWRRRPAATSQQAPATAMSAADESRY